MSTKKIARTAPKSKTLETSAPPLQAQPAQEDDRRLGNVHPEDIRAYFRDARDASARALALLAYVDKLRRESNAEANGTMIEWLTQDAYDALGEAHHAACTGLLTSGASHEYETEADAMRAAAKGAAHV